MDIQPKGCSEKQFTEFIQQVAKLNAVEFIGLTKILVVPIVDENNETREFEEMLSDVLDRFVAANRKVRKEVMKMLKSANLEKIDK